jgi:hypothetical protein
MPFTGNTFGTITATPEGTFGNDDGLGDLLTTSGQMQIGSVLTGPGTNYIVLPPDISSRQARAADFERTFYHGSVPGADFLAARSIGLRFTMRTSLSNFQSRVDTLSAAFKPRTSSLVCLAWMLPDGTKRCYFGRPRRFQADLSAAAKVVMASAEFVATDPLAYTLPQTVVQRGAPTFSGQMGPAPVSAPVGGSGSSATFAVTNNGNFDMPWWALLSGPLSSPKIANTSTGQYLEFAGEVPSGSYLYISSQSKQVLFNGRYGAYGRLTITSQWWDFPPGTTNVLWLPGTSDSNSLYMTYRSAYI